MSRPQKANIANIFNSETSTKPSRTGSGDKIIKLVFHMQATAKQQLDHLVIDIGKTKQDLVIEAVNDLFIKYGKPSIASKGAKKKNV